MESEYENKVVSSLLIRLQQPGYYDIGYWNNTCKQRVIYNMY